MNRRRFLQAWGALAAAPAANYLLASATANSSMPNTDSTDAVTLFLGGDVMTARGIDQIIPHPSDHLIHEAYMKSAAGYIELAEQVSGPIPRKVDFDYIWGDALEVLDASGPDFRIVNLETSVTISDERWPSKGINYRMNPANVPVLSAVGIDCCALANNHVLDFSQPGLEETLDSLDGAGIPRAGAGRDLEEAVAPAEFDLPGGGKLRIYSAASSNSGIPREWAAQDNRPGIAHLGWLDPAITRAIEDRIRADKRPGDLAVASVHWGGNWGYDVHRDQRLFARRLIDAGADVVHGHSSHHAKGIEVYNGRPVIYGAGDLINDYEGIESANDAYRGELPLLYFLRLDRTTGELERLWMRPMRISRFRLQHASRAEAEWLCEILDREGQRLNTRVQVAGEGLELTWEN